MTAEGTERLHATRPTAATRAIIVDAGGAVPGVRAAVARVAPGTRPLRVEGVPALEAALRARDWDLVVVAGSPDAAALDALLARVRAVDPELPVVVAAAAPDDEALRATAAGAFGVADPAGPAALDALLRAALERDGPRGGSAGALAAVTRLLADLDGAVDQGEVVAAMPRALGAVAGLPYVETWLDAGEGALAPGPCHAAHERFLRLRDAPVGQGAVRGSLVREALARRRAVAIDDLEGPAAAGFLRAPLARALGLRMVHAAPLVAGRRAVGAVLAFGDAARPLGREERALVDLVAARVGASLARLDTDAGARAERAAHAALLDHVGDGVAACDATGRVTTTNAALALLLGGTLRVGSAAPAWEAAGHLRLDDGAAPVPAERAPFSRALRGERFEDGPFTIDTPAGRRRVLRVSGEPFTGGAGQVAGAVVAVRDVGERVAAERAAGDAAERARRSFALRLDELAALAREVGEAEDLVTVWHAVLGFAHHTLGAHGLLVVRRRDDGALLPLHAARCAAGGRPEAVAGDTIDVPSEALAQAVAERAVVLAPAADGGSLAAVPLVLGGEAVGAFAVLAPPGRAFGSDAAAALTMVGSLAAIALDHDDLVRGERLARAAAETSARQFRQIFDVGPVGLGIVGRDDGSFVDLNPALADLLGAPREALVGAQPAAVGLALPRDAGDVAPRVRSREVTVRRADGTARSCLVSTEPMDLHGERAELVLVVDVSERLEQQQRLRNLARFRESLMAFIGETLEVGFDGPFYQRLLQSAVEVTPHAQAGSLLVREVGSDSYRFVAAVGYDLEGLGPVRLLDHEIVAAKVAGKAVVSRALPTHGEAGERGEVLRRFGRLDEIRSTLTVPIHLEGRRVASLSLDNFERGDAFDEEAQQLAEAFASQVATLIKRRALERELEHMAYHDNLTGLPNRVLFRDRLQQAVSRAVRGGRHGAAIFIDLDNLKVTNDALGHSVGDMLLQAVARRLLEAVRAEDTVARIGGDEFTMVLADVPGSSGAATVAEKILTVLAEPFRLSGHEVHVSASVGITLFPDDGTDADLLIRHGDAAMYHAKAQGKARYRFFTREMNQQLLERASLEAQLRKALERGEFEIHYQPRVSLTDGRITGLEALARWHHPERGWIAPSTFIAIAEDAGLIGQVAAHLLDLVCRQAKAWEDAGTPMVVAFNVSVKQLQERELVQTVGSALERSGLPPRLLELELTESAIMRNVDDAVQKLAQLRELGVSVAIDDFGTAYSSLSYLKRLPATTLKIDRSFVRDVGERRQAPTQDAAIVRAVVALAAALDLTAIAEGVETVAQLAFLRDVGCHQAQGFLLAPPAPAHALSGLLRAGSIALPV